MSGVNASGWRPEMGSAEAADMATASGDKGLMLEEPLIFELAAPGTTGVDIDAPGAQPLASLGKFLRKDMAALYHAMDVFLLPSLFEGLPVVLVEAQAAGLPCFVADTVDPGAAFAGNIHYLPLQNEAAWADSIAAADLTRDPNAQAKAIAAGFDVHTSAGILQKFYLEQTQKYTKEVQP